MTEIENSSIPTFGRPKWAIESTMAKPHQLILRAHYLVLAAVLLGLLLQGLPYYLTPLLLRPRHELYWDWKPGGDVGRLLGLVGASMMTLMLAYSLRKRIARFRSLGRLSIWLDYHILLGIFGPLLVVLHTSFKVGGLVSIAFWSMLVVASSGVFGRYLYVLIPRSVDGEELSREAVWTQYEEVCESLRDHFSVSSEEIERLRKATAAILEPDRSAVHLLLTAPRDRLRLRALLRQTLQHWTLQHRTLQHRADRTSAVGRDFDHALREAFRLHRRALLLTKVRTLFHYWHVFHKPFAVVMYVLMLVHIGVASMTGYGLIRAG